MNREPRSILRKSFVIQGGKCFYCGNDTEFRKWTVDHKIPKSRYWQFGKQGFDSNCVGCCSSCNHAKGNMTLNEFVATDYLPSVRRVILGFVGQPKSFTVEKENHAIRLPPNNKHRRTVESIRKVQPRNLHTHFEKQHYAFTWEWGLFL